ncbi:hypothetical protein ACOME3_000383 [Neoechinorhynchus agilis]
MSANSTLTPMSDQSAYFHNDLDESKRTMEINGQAGAIGSNDDIAYASITDSVIDDTSNLDDMAIETTDRHYSKIYRNGNLETFTNNSNGYRQSPNSTVVDGNNYVGTGSNEESNEETMNHGSLLYSQNETMNTRNEGSSASVKVDISNKAMLPLSSYKLQYDSNPIVVRKPANSSPTTYRQNIHIKFLKPPPPPAPGPLIVREIRAPQAPPAPPLIIRQRPPRPPTPPPLILREKPPPLPVITGPKVIQKHLPALPPPPRQVIIERYPPLPPKPRDIIIERWLPYGPIPKRNVIYQKAPQTSKYKTPKNMIVNYQVPKPHIKRVFVKETVQHMDPNWYVSRYQQSLMDSMNLVNAARQVGVTEDITPPKANHSNVLNDYMKSVDEGSYGSEYASGGINDEIGLQGELFDNGAGIQSSNDQFNVITDNDIKGQLQSSALRYEASTFNGINENASAVHQSSYMPINEIIQQFDSGNSANSISFDGNNVLGMVNANMNYESGDAVISETGPYSVVEAGDQVHEIGGNVLGGADFGGFGVDQYSYGNGDSYNGTMHQFVES